MAREYLESTLLRHGDIAELSRYIERGEKPPYADFVKFVEGQFDPPVDEEATRNLIKAKFKNRQEGQASFDSIICSPALRAQQTAGLIRDELHLDSDIHPTQYLDEVKISMAQVTSEFYEKAKDIHEVRAKFMESFLNGEKVDEDIVDVFKRAREFLTYFRRVRKWTSHQPLLVTHSIFCRFIDLATRHEGEELTDEQIRALVQEEFSKTQRPGTLEGFRISSSPEGTKVLGVV